jgi:hypothetical protein
MQIDYPVALGILASYFVLIFFLLWRIYPQLKHAITQGSKSIFGFLILSVISLGFTWFYMFAFFRHSYLEWKIDDQSEMELSLNSLSHWLNDVSLFDSAWRTVNVGDWPWLWSHQICSFTVAVWTPILAIEG